MRYLGCLKLNADGRVVEPGGLCCPEKCERIRVVFGEYRDPIARLQAKLSEQLGTLEQVAPKRFITGDVPVENPGWFGRCVFRVIKRVQSI